MASASRRSRQKQSRRWRLRDIERQIGDIPVGCQFRDQRTTLRTGVFGWLAVAKAGDRKISAAPARLARSRSSIRLSQGYR